MWASAAGAQTAFGSPVVKRDPAQKHMRVSHGHVVKKIDAVEKTQRALANITAANASGAQVVTLAYGQHKTYTIPVRRGMFTTLSLPKNEPIQQFAVSDPDAVKLNVNAGTNTAMLKLVQSVTVVGTVVTDKHVFYLQITPAGDDAPWYQGVSWSFGTDAFGESGFASGVYVANQDAHDSGASLGGKPSADPMNSIYSGTPNFDYAVKGDAPFRPQAVWDNGRFTWIQFPKNLQELPAIFVDGPNGLEIVNYTVHANGTQILVNRLMPAFVLKLGKSSIRVEAKR